MENKYNDILVCVDDSEMADRAFQEALVDAKKNEAHLTVLYVVNDSAYHTNNLDQMITKLVDAEASYAKSKMEKRQVLMEHNNLSYKTEIAYGIPKYTIEKYCLHHKGIDLVVLGATGSDSKQRCPVGSTTSYAVDHVSCNVLIVR